MTGDYGISSAIHIFEKAGLGRAPFRIIGVEERRGPMVVSQQNGVTVICGSPGQPMGSCDYCGTGIAECWIIESADTKKFIVGSHCVYKSGDSGLRRVINKHKREAAKKRELLRIKSADENLEADLKLRETLAAIPSPNRWRPSDSALDWASWMMQHAGHSGKMKVARLIDKVRASNGKD